MQISAALVPLDITHSGSLTPSQFRDILAAIQPELQDAERAQHRLIEQAAIANDEIEHYKALLIIERQATKDAERRLRKAEAELGEEQAASTRNYAAWLEAIMERDQLRETAPDRRK
jgi:hypothetical protein